MMLGAGVLGARKQLEDVSLGCDAKWQHSHATC